MLHNPQVFLNQTVLAPVVLTVVFSWNLLLTGQASQISSKIQNDLVPTMVNGRQHTPPCGNSFLTLVHHIGWKFWVPAASLNFYVVPLQHQVLYMSTCSVLWTAYLSYMSYNNARVQAKQ